MEIESISFPQDRYVGVLPYQINLKYYPSGLFSGVYGILSPSDTWSFKEQSNEILDITHIISCQPFNTSSGPSNALDNARNWAFGRTGISTTVYPILISGVSPSNFSLLTQQETIDRFNGTYSLTENYTNDLARAGYGTVRYSTTIESGSNLITVSLNGTAQGNNRNITGIRAVFANLDKTAIAATAYRQAFGMTDLNPTPVTRSFNEDPFTAKIDFSYSFDNSNLPNVLFDYTVGCSVGTNGSITATIQGAIRARGGDLASRLVRCQAYAATIDLYSLVLPFYNNFDASSIAPLNPIPLTNAQTNNQTEGTVQLNATFNNHEKVSPLLDKFEYSLDFAPSLAQVDAKPILNGLGNWSVVNLNFASRATLSIDGTAIINRDVSADAGAAAIRQIAFNLFSKYGNYSNAALEKDIVTVSRTDNRVASFGFTWTFGPTNIVGPTSINGLTI